MLALLARDTLHSHETDLFDQSVTRSKHYLVGILQLLPRALADPGPSSPSVDHPQHHSSLSNYLLMKDGEVGSLVWCWEGSLLVTMMLPRCGQWCVSCWAMLMCSHVMQSAQLRFAGTVPVSNVITATVETRLRDQHRWDRRWTLRYAMLDLVSPFSGQHPHIPSWYDTTQLEWVDILDTQFLPFIQHQFKINRLIMMRYKSNFQYFLLQLIR